MSFLGKYLLSNKGKVTSQLNFELPVLAYFTATWCITSHSFTSKLIDFYLDHNNQGKNIEVIFCSLDTSEQDFSKFLGLMPWKAISFDKKELVHVLAVRLNVEYLPSLIQIDKNGKSVESDCKKIIEESRDRAYDIFLNNIRL